MTITFESDKDVIVYALEKIISHARENSYIFLAQSVWWIASIIGLQQQLIVYIDNKQASDKVLKQFGEKESIQGLRELSGVPRDIQEDPRNTIEIKNIHPDRQSQIQIPGDDISDLHLEDIRQKEVVEKTEQFIQLTRKERKAFNKQKQQTLTSATRSGRIVKPVKKKQKSYLQNIPKDSLSEYLEKRK
jgi:hypothetical protein